MKQTLAYTIAQNGNATIYLNYQSFHVNVGAANYDQVMETLKDKNLSEDKKIEKLFKALDIRTALTKHLSDYISVVDNELYYNGVEVKNSLSQRIIDFFYKDYPVEYLVRFFERLQSNPSNRAKNELFNFLEKNTLLITDGGEILAYKAVRENYTDKQTGAFDNSVGKVVKIPRNLVDDDAHKGCSYGLHVGTYEFAKQFGGIGWSTDRLILVKVDPANCVSVPIEDAGKMRVCEYLVIADVTQSEPITTAYVEEASVSQLKPVVVQPRDSNGRFASKNSAVKPTQSRDANGRFASKVAAYVEEEDFSFATQHSDWIIDVEWCIGNDLYINKHDGDYIYHARVPYNVALDFEQHVKNGGSAGKYYNQHIKDNYN